MKWFMHASGSSRDASLQKVLIRYGFQGYGLYWYCLEQICADVDPKLTFELQQDSEILAHIGKLDFETVEGMMRYMVELGLFAESEGMITCMKLARYLGHQNTRNGELKKIIKNEKGLDWNETEVSQTVTDSHGLSEIVTARGEESRGEEIRLENKNKNTRVRMLPPTLDQVKEYIIEKSLEYTVADDCFDYYSANGWKQKGGNPIKDWKATVRAWDRRQQEFGKPKAAVANKPRTSWDRRR